MRFYALRAIPTFASGVARTADCTPNEYGGRAVMSANDPKRTWPNA